MDYIIDNLIPTLIHPTVDTFIEEKTLKNIIWYGISIQSYLQRTKMFDETWLCSATSDDYIVLFLLEVLNLNEINIYDKVCTCNLSVRALSQESLKDKCIHIAKDRASLFLNFFEKIRNAMAHGAINCHDNYCYLINQHKPKPNAQVSFLLQTQVDINSILQEMWGNCKLATEQEVNFKYRCLEKFLQLNKVDGYYYSQLHNCYVIIDDEFRYTTRKHVDDIKALMIKYNSMSKSVVIIISENLGNISEKNLISEDGKVRVIAQSKIIEYFHIQGVNRIFEKNN